MDSDSDSSLSSAPPSPSTPIQAEIEVEEPIKEPSPQPTDEPPAEGGSKNKKSKTETETETGIEIKTKQPPKASTSTSRRSSRVAESDSRQSSPKPDKLEPAADDVVEQPKVQKIKLKFRAPSPSKPNQPDPPTPTLPSLPENQDEVLYEPVKAKKRKPAAVRTNTDDEFKEKIGSKRPRITHPDVPIPDVEPEKPVNKKGKAIKKVRKGESTTATEDLMDMGLFSDEEEDDKKEPEAGPSGTSAMQNESEVVAEPPLKRTEASKKVKKIKKRRLSEDLFGDDSPMGDEVIATSPEKPSTSKPVTKKDKEPNPKPKPKREPESNEQPQPSKTGTKSAEKGRAADTPPIEQDKPAQVVRKSKSFAQAVTGVASSSTKPDTHDTAPPTPAPGSVPVPAAKKEKKPLPTIPTISKLANSGTNAIASGSSPSTPQTSDRRPPNPAPGSSSSIKKGPPIPAIKKPVQPPSLLESTMKALLSNSASASSSTSNSQKKEVSSSPSVSRDDKKREADMFLFFCV